MASIESVVDKDGARSASRETRGSVADGPVAAPVWAPVAAQQATRAADDCGGGCGTISYPRWAKKSVAPEDKDSTTLGLGQIIASSLDHRENPGTKWCDAVRSGYFTGELNASNDAVSRFNSTRVLLTLRWDSPRKPLRYLFGGDSYASTKLVDVAQLRSVEVPDADVLFESQKEGTSLSEALWRKRGNIWQHWKSQYIRGLQSSTWYAQVMLIHRSVRFRGWNGQSQCPTSSSRIEKKRQVFAAVSFKPRWRRWRDTKLGVAQRNEALSTLRKQYEEKIRSHFDEVDQAKISWWSYLRRLRLRSLEELGAEMELELPQYLLFIIISYLALAITFVFVLSCTHMYLKVLGQLCGLNAKYGLPAGVEGDGQNDKMDEEQIPSSPQYLFSAWKSMWDKEQNRFSPQYLFSAWKSMWVVDWVGDESHVSKANKKFDIKAFDVEKKARIELLVGKAQQVCDIFGRYESCLVYAEKLVRGITFELPDGGEHLLGLVLGAPARIIYDIYAYVAWLTPRPLNHLSTIVGKGLPKLGIGWWAVVLLCVVLVYYRRSLSMPNFRRDVANFVYIESKEETRQISWGDNYELFRSFASSRRVDSMNLRLQRWCREQRASFGFDAYASFLEAGFDLDIVTTCSTSTVESINAKNMGDLYRAIRAFEHSGRYEERNIFLRALFSSAGSMESLRDLEWRDYYQELKLHYDIMGNCRVPPEFSFLGSGLADWVTLQRLRLKHLYSGVPTCDTSDRLTAEQCKLLEQLNLICGEETARSKRKSNQSGHTATTATRRQFLARQEAAHMEFEDSAAQKLRKGHILERQEAREMQLEDLAARKLRKDLPSILWRATATAIKNCDPTAHDKCRLFIRYGCNPNLACIRDDETNAEVQRLLSDMTLQEGIKDAIEAQQKVFSESIVPILRELMMPRIIIPGVGALFAAAALCYQNENIGPRQVLWSTGKLCGQLSLILMPMWMIARQFRDEADAASLRAREEMTRIGQKIQSSGICTLLHVAAEYDHEGAITEQLLNSGGVAGLRDSLHRTAFDCCEAGSKSQDVLRRFRGATIPTYAPLLGEPCCVATDHDDLNGVLRDIELTGLMHIELEDGTMCTADVLKVRSQAQDHKFRFAGAPDPDTNGIALRFAMSQLPHIQQLSRVEKYDYICHCFPYYLPTMVVMSFDNIAHFGKMAHSKQGQHISIDQLPQDSVVIFFSQTWLRGKQTATQSEGSAGLTAQGDDITPNPDSLNGEPVLSFGTGIKARQMMRAMDEIASMRNIDKSKVFAWYDFSSVDQDLSYPWPFMAAINALPLYLALCDFFVCSTVDAEGGKEWKSRYENRIWCRLEMQASWFCHHIVNGSPPWEKMVVDDTASSVKVVTFAKDQLPCEDPANGAITKEADRGPCVLLSALLSIPSGGSEVISIPKVTDAESAPSDGDWEFSTRRSTVSGALWGASVDILTLYAGLIGKARPLHFYFIVGMVIATKGLVGDEIRRLLHGLAVFAVGFYHADLLEDEDYVVGFMFLFLLVFQHRDEKRCWHCAFHSPLIVLFDLDWVRNGISDLEKSADDYFKPEVRFTLYLLALAGTTLGIKRHGSYDFIGFAAGMILRSFLFLCCYFLGSTPAAFLPKAKYVILFSMKYRYRSAASSHGGEVSGLFRDAKYAEMITLFSLAVFAAGKEQPPADSCDDDDAQIELILLRHQRFAISILLLSTASVVLMTGWAPAQFIFKIFTIWHSCLLEEGATAAKQTGAWALDVSREVVQLGRLFLSYFFVGWFVCLTSNIQKWSAADSFIFILALVWFFFCYESALKTGMVDSTLIKQSHLVRTYRQAGLLAHIEQSNTIGLYSAGLTFVARFRSSVLRVLSGFRQGVFRLAGFDVIKILGDVVVKAMLWIEKIDGKNGKVTVARPQYNIRNRFVGAIVSGTVAGFAGCYPEEHNLWKILALCWAYLFAFTRGSIFRFAILLVSTYYVLQWEQSAWVHPGASQPQHDWVHKPQDEEGEEMHMTFTTTKTSTVSFQVWSVMWRLTKIIYLGFLFILSCASSVAVGSCVVSVHVVCSPWYALVLFVMLANSSALVRLMSMVINTILPSHGGVVSELVERVPRRDTISWILFLVVIASYYLK